jgi:tryptophanyl-tRNA synthetase
MADKAFMEKSYRESAEKASYFAEKMLAKVKRKIGFVGK